MYSPNHALDSPALCRYLANSALI